MSIQSLLRILLGLVEPNVQPKSPEWYVRRGYDRLAKHDDFGGIADFSESLRMNRSFAAYVGRGTAYHETGEYEKAIADCTVAILLNPKCAEGYYLRGLARLRKRDYENGLPDLFEADRLGLQDAQERQRLRMMMAECPAIRDKQEDD